MGAERAGGLRIAGPAVLSLVLAWLAVRAMDDQVDLANRAMLFILAAVLGSWRLPLPGSFAFGLICVLAFNWVVVPPQGSLKVDNEDHAVLLFAMLAIVWIVVTLISRLRTEAERARSAAHWAARLQALGEALRDSADPRSQATTVVDLLVELGGKPAAVLVLKGVLPPGKRAEAAQWLGELDTDERAGLWLCLRESRAFGPGTGRHDEQPAWYLPLRASGGSQGAALVRLARPSATQETTRARAQAVCDLLGAALQRAALAEEAGQARLQADGQAVRNALLAAISHDYRTPLAVILGAASSLRDQGERLPAAQREHLAASIVDEVAQLDRMTDNTLQLARLDSPGVRLRLDWESAEEVVGTALRHARQRDPQRRVRARLQPDLPLLRCDALLLSQALDNLIDNALKYSPAPSNGAGVSADAAPAATPVELWVRRQPSRPGEVPALGWIVLAVRDRGPGVPPAQRERIFEVFQRGEPTAGAPPAGSTAQRGAGVGLAVCRAIARAHGGELRLRPRAHGGSSFEFWLPHAEPPAAPADLATEQEAT